MRDHPPYITRNRRLREGRYRRTLAVAAMVAVFVHGMMAVAGFLIGSDLPLVRRSGYRGPIQLMPEISILREQAEYKSEEQISGEHLGASGFRMVDLRLDGVRPPEGPPAEADPEELDAAIGDDPRNSPEGSRQQPAGQQIVIEHMVEPIYPPSAIENGIEGVAVVGISVDSRGIVREAWLVRSEVTGECNLEARRALLQWRFAPYLVDGRPAPFRKFYRVRFELTDDALKTARATARSRGRATAEPESSE
jgi:TonB family protein